MTTVRPARTASTHDWPSVRTYVRICPIATRFESFPLAPTSGNRKPASHRRYTHGQERRRARFACHFDRVDLAEDRRDQRLAADQSRRPARTASTQTTRPALAVALVAPVADDQSSDSSPPNVSGNTGRCEFSSADLAQHRVRVERVHDDGAAVGFERRRLAAEREQVRRGGVGVAVHARVSGTVARAGSRRPGPRPPLPAAPRAA